MKPKELLLMVRSINNSSLICYKNKVICSNFPPWWFVCLVMGYTAEWRCRISSTERHSSSWWETLCSLLWSSGLWTPLHMLFDAPYVSSDTRDSGAIKGKAPFPHLLFLLRSALPLTCIQLLMNEVPWKGYPIKSRNTWIKDFLCPPWDAGNLISATIPQSTLFLFEFWRSR